MTDLDFFDCNCYLGPVNRPPLWTYPSAAQLLADMDHFGIREAAVTHTIARDYRQETGNRAVLEALEGQPRLHGCWVLKVHGDAFEPPIADQVDEMLAAGVRVVRLLPPARHPYVLADWATRGLWGALAERRIPVLLTASDLAKHPDDRTAGFSAENVYTLCREHPDLPVIILRFNYTSTRVTLPILERCPNLYLEISYFTLHRGVELITRLFGAERLIFGTGAPVSNPGLALALVRYANVSDADRRAIAGENFRRLLEGVYSS